LQNSTIGDVTPSAENVLVTRELVAAGKLLDIDPLDHLIVSQNKWLSMREKGLDLISSQRQI
jgi:DNA repair protein RadC